MIEYVRGKLAELQPAKAVVETGGVGYGLSISLSTYTALQGRSEVRLWVYEVIREDAYLLFGFATDKERALFAKLLSVSGIGSATALMALSAFSPAELAGIVESEDVRALKQVKGIGPKAAQRIIVDLKGKLEGFLGVDTSQAGAGSNKGVVITPLVEEAVQALTTLGFPPAIAQKTVIEIIRQAPDSTVQQVIKQALKML